MTRKDREEFRGFCRNATDNQIRNIYRKEKDANRDDYAEIARSEMIKRGMEV